METLRGAEHIFFDSPIELQISITRALVKFSIYRLSHSLLDCRNRFRPVHRHSSINIVITFAQLKTINILVSVEAVKFTQKQTEKIAHNQSESCIP